MQYTTNPIFQSSQQPYTFDNTQGIPTSHVQPKLIYNASSPKPTYIQFPIHPIIFHSPTLSPYLPIIPSIYLLTHPHTHK